MIEVDVSKKIKIYNGHNLLRVNTSFATGKITQVLGISGSGKTTMLKIIAGLISPDQGSIVVNKSVWLNTADKIYVEPQRRDVGFVFQDYALFPNMTVEEHLMFGTKDSLYISQLAKLGQMEPYLRHKPRQLSGGQQQRLAILRALATRPGLLLMDEPFSALDKGLKTDVINALKELIVAQGTTCLVVTHDPFKEGEFADETFELKQNDSANHP